VSHGIRRYRPLGCSVPPPPPPPPAPTKLARLDVARVLLVLKAAASSYHGPFEQLAQRVKQRSDEVGQNKGSL
jgi:hypothetical protein